MSAKIRKKIFIYNQLSSEGHLPSSFSIVEILISIFQAEGCDPDPTWLSRLILSKGHASFAYYGFLASIGFMTEEEEKSICQNGSKLYGHLPHIIGDNRFTFGSGSLGHGLPYAIGRSFGDHTEKKYYCIVGDGEANEGTFWESLLLFEKFQSNLSIIIDCNKSSERAIPIDSKIKKIHHIFPFLNSHEVNGHDINKLGSLLLRPGPQLLICDTVKGFPFKAMMDSPMWHHKTPSILELKKFMDDLV